MKWNIHTHSQSNELRMKHEHHRTTMMMMSIIHKQTHTNTSSKINGIQDFLVYIPTNQYNNCVVKQEIEIGTFGEKKFYMHQLCTTKRFKMMIRSIFFCCLGYIVCYSIQKFFFLFEKIHKNGATNK